MDSTEQLTSDTPEADGRVARAQQRVSTLGGGEKRQALALGAAAVRRIHFLRQPLHRLQERALFGKHRRDLLQRCHRVNRPTFYTSPAMQGADP